MAQFFGPQYFQDLERTLNGDAEFKAKTANVNATILMVNRDTKKSFLLKVERGTATITEGNEETKADFTFIGDTLTWWANHRGDVSMEKLVLTGKLKFKGSIPKIMGMKAQLNVIDKLAQSVQAQEA